MWGGGGVEKCTDLPGEHKKFGDCDRLVYWVSLVLLWSSSAFFNPELQVEGEWLHHTHTHTH